MGTASHERMTVEPSRKRVALVVPHANCRDKIENACDQMSRLSANMVHEALQEKGIESFLLFPNTHRIKDGDENREEMRQSDYRQSIRSKKFDLLLDIHSYPAGSFQNQGKNGVYLYLRNQTPLKLQMAAQQAGFGPVEGSHKNSIMAEFWNRAILLEFRDELGPFQRREAARDLATALGPILK